MIFSKLIKSFFMILLIVIIPVGLYILTALILTFFPSKSLSIIKKEQKVYILYNEMHTDILFNLEELSHSPSSQWIKNLPIVLGKKGYIAFGWGDKETYLNTPTWNQLKASTSLKALFINTPSLMHVSYYPTLNYFPNIKTIALTQSQKDLLIKTIFKGFNFKEKSFRGYGVNDIFYSSIYKYNLIYTCNTWTGDTLRTANISVSYWTPFSYNVVHSLP